MLKKEKSFLKLIKDRHDATLSKHRYLRNFGDLVVKKECELQQDFSQAKKYVSKITRTKLLKEIHLGAYFGAAICDIHVPEHLQEK